MEGRGEAPGGGKRVAVRADVLFTDHKGRERKGLVKSRGKLLAKLEPLLSRFMEPGEEVLLVSRGCSPAGILEQLTTGWLIHYVKQCALVFTDRRILHLPTRGKTEPRQSIAQVWYGDIEKYWVRSLGGVLILKYASGRKEQFLNLPGAERRKLKALLPTLVTAAAPSERRERHHLCPRCKAPLAAGSFTCPACRLVFRDSRRAVILSVLVPGGGYFYTGHPWLGFQDAIVETALIVVLATAVLDGSRGGGWEGAVVIGLLLLVEKLLTVYHARHYIGEYIPVDKEIRPLDALGGGP